MSRTKAVGLIAAFTVGLLLNACAGSNAPPHSNAAVRSITVAAASDLRPAFEAIARTFTADTGVDVVFVFGSSGLLREQVLNGAPFDVFASANADFVDAVLAAGRGDPATRTEYAVGRLALWSPPGSQPATSVADLADPRFRRIAIANPDHAPYGVAAVQALRSAGVHDIVTSRLVYGDNIADALRIVRSGNADAGIVALSLAIAEATPYDVIPSSLHAPIRQTLVVTSTGAHGDAAAAFAEYLTTEPAQRIMRDYGFEAP